MISFFKKEEKSWLDKERESGILEIRKLVKNRPVISILDQTCINID